MAREKTEYSCSECGASSPKWLGKCPGCGAWNTLVETVVENAGAAKNRFAALAPGSAVATLADIEATDVARTPTGIGELDRVLGGGMVAGSAILLGGDPGVGKSTLAIQLASGLAARGEVVLYAPGGRYIRGGELAESCGPLRLRSRVPELLAAVAAIGADPQPAGAGWCAKGGQRRAVWATAPSLVLAAMEICGGRSGER